VLNKTSFIADLKELTDVTDFHKQAKGERHKTKKSQSPASLEKS
jgi:hypothetical protein